MKEKVIFSWSGGKDSAIALHEIQKAGQYEIRTLLTTVNAEYDRISIHGVRRELLEQQALSLGLPLEQILLLKDFSNEEYENKMQKTLEKYKEAGVNSVVFGDIFLEDLKQHRENKLSTIGMTGVFPIWKKDTRKLAQKFIDSGFKAVITCVDSQVLDKKFVGREFDSQFLSELDDEIDPCGENGEFHSFVYDGPIFQNTIKQKRGEIVLRAKRFYFCDLIADN